MALTQRHPDTDAEILRECIEMRTAFASWLLKRQQAQMPLTPDALRDAWQTAWVEGVLSERRAQYAREKQARQEATLHELTRNAVVQ